MKFGIIREKFGDIIVYPEGADFVVQKENSEYFKNNLKELIRFKKSNIDIYERLNRKNYKSVRIRPSEKPKQGKKM